MTTPQIIQGTRVNWRDRNGTITWASQTNCRIVSVQFDDGSTNDHVNFDDCEVVEESGSR